MTHLNIILFEKYNPLIGSNLENRKIFKLLSLFKKWGFIILFFIGCSTSYIHAQTPQQIQSKTFQTKAEWFLKLPQFNIDSCEIYYYKAIDVLKPNESAHYQALSEVNLSLYLSLLRIKKSTKIDTCLKLARYYFDKIPQKSEQTKLLEYKILIREADESFANNEQTKANKLMVQAFGLVQEDKSPNVQALYLYDKANLYGKIRSDEVRQGLEMSYRFAQQSRNIYESSTVRNKNEILFKVYDVLGWYHNYKANSDSCDYYFEKQKVLLPLIKNP